jgi:hypothetical protein
MSLAGRGATRPTTPPSAGWDDAVWIAQRMVLDAGAEAARLRQQASVQAATIREAAEREAGMVWQQASMQAAAAREAAEREAAELRATIIRLSAASGEPAYIDRDVARPRAGGLLGKPGTGTAGKPATRRLQGAPRQLVALRVAAAATAAFVLVALSAGTAELALHGFTFFVFRGGGVGETGGTATDQQFLAKEAAAAKAAADPADHGRAQCSSGTSRHPTKPC